MFRRCRSFRLSTTRRKNKANSKKAAIHNYVSTDNTGDELKWVAGITGVDDTISGDVVVPDTLGGYPVTYLGYRVFMDNENVKSIVLPESVTGINIEAFYRCPSIESVTAPGAKYIGNRAFAAATNLKEINLSSDLKEVGGWAFDGSGYYNDENNWENGALYYGNCLVKCGSATAPEKLVIKDGTRMIAAFACEYSSMKEVYMPDSVVKIGQQAFDFCRNLETLRLSQSLTEIPFCAFRCATRLKELVIPEGVKAIGNFAFGNCDSLTELRIPAAVESLDYAFGECRSLKEITVDPANKNYYSGDGIIIKRNYDYGYDNALICYPAGKTAEIYTLPSDIDCVAGTGFSGCEALKEVKITDNCKEFRWGVFKNCTSLERVNFPKNIERIENSLLEGCVSLSEVTIPDTVREIGDSAFRKCESLKSVDIPSSVKRIETYAFIDCPALNEIIIRSDDAVIGYLALGYFANGISVETNDDLVIKSYKGSTAEAYALEKGFSFVEIERPVDPSENCTCRCHKGGFDNFIYRIFRIFWKLFRTNEDCSCGAKHY